MRPAGTSATLNAKPYDLILAGGGLANGLIAWRLRLSLIHI